MPRQAGWGKKTQPKKRAGRRPLSISPQRAGAPLVPSLGRSIRNVARYVEAGFLEEALRLHDADAVGTRLGDHVVDHLVDLLYLLVVLLARDRHRVAPEDVVGPPGQ